MPFLWSKLVAVFVVSTRVLMLKLLKLKAKDLRVNGKFNKRLLGKNSLGKREKGRKTFSEEPKLLEGSPKARFQRKIVDFPLL